MWSPGTHLQPQVLIKIFFLFCLNAAKISLPYPVDEENGSAKFDKSKRQLTVTLPVLPALLTQQLVGSLEAFD